MSFPYFPRRLGKPVPPKPVRDEKGAEDQPPKQLKDFSLLEWMETHSKSWASTDVEPIADTNFLKQLKPNARVVVLGEPGAGKSWLAAQLTRQIAEQYHQPSSWTSSTWTVPFFARCRALKQGREGTIWDVLEDWSSSVELGQPILRADVEKLRSPYQLVLIVDGLDELPHHALDKFIASLEPFQGLVVLTCRSANWESKLRAKFAKQPEVYQLLGLNPTEQAEFLTASNAKLPKPAKEFIRELHQNQSLQALCGNPLLLSLIVQHGTTLPNNRAELYEEFIKQRCNNLDTKPLIEHARTLKPYESILIPLQIQQFMQSVAKQLVVDSQVQLLIDSGKIIKAIEENSKVPELLYDAILTTGLITLEGDKSYAFIHPTFQEYALAKAWLFQGNPDATVQQLEQNLIQAIEDHWLEVTLEETLALMLSIAEKKKVNIKKALQTLVETKVPLKTMRVRQRSALRTALHLITRSGISVGKKLEEYLWVRLMDTRQQLHLARDLFTPIAVLTRLASKSNVNIRSAVAANLSTSESAFLKLLEDSTEKVRVNLAGNPSVTEAILMKLASDSSGSVRYEVAKNSSATKSILSKLMNDSKEYVRMGITENSSVSEAILTKLANDPSEVVRIYVARSPFVTENILLMFLEDLKKIETFTPSKTFSLNLKVIDEPNSKIYWEISKSVFITESIMFILANHPDPIFRSQIAKNPAATEAVLLKLLHDPYARTCIAENLSATESVLLEISKLSISERFFSPLDIASHSSATEAVLLELLDSSDEILRLKKARDSTINEATLLELANDSNEIIRFCLTTNPSITETVLLKLTNDSNTKIRLSIAKNLSITETVLLRLAGDSSEYVRFLVAQNPSATESVLLKLIKDLSERVRLGIAMNSSATKTVLKKLTNDPSGLVRFNVAIHPSSTNAVLVELLNDPNEGVWWSLTENPRILLEDLKLQSSGLRFVKSAQLGAIKMWHSIRHLFSGKDN